MEGGEIRSTFIIKNGVGEKLFYGLEKHYFSHLSNKFCTAFCHANYKIIIFDLQGNELVHITRSTDICGRGCEVLHILFIYESAYY